MTIERAAGALDGALEEVEQAIEHLVWSLDQGKSSAQLRHGHALADQHQAVADDMLGLAKEARAAIGALLGTLGGQFDLVGARRALATAQDCLNGPWSRGPACCRSRSRPPGSRSASSRDAAARESVVPSRRPRSPPARASDRGTQRRHGTEVNDGGEQEAVLQGTSYRP